MCEWKWSLQLHKYILNSGLRLSRNITKLLANISCSALVSALVSPFVHGKCFNGAESDSEYLISMWLWAQSMLSCLISNLALFCSQLRSFLEDLFSKAVMINTRDSELCISSSVSCSHSAAGVEMAEVQLSTILSAMDVCVFFHTSICNCYPIQAGHPKLITLSCWWPCYGWVLTV